MRSIEISRALEMIEEGKPYNVCIKCTYFNDGACDGPNFFDMTQDRRVEWLQLRRAYLRSIEPWKWSYAYIAEAAELSEGAVIRCFNDVNYDPRVTTLAAILKVMCNSWGKNPCALDADQVPQTVFEDKPETLLEMATLRERLDKTYRTLDGIHESYAVEMTTIRDGEQKKIDFLTQEVSAKNEQIAMLNAQIKNLNEQMHKLIDKLVN